VLILDPNYIAIGYLVSLYELPVVIVKDHQGERMIGDMIQLWHPVPFFRNEDHSVLVSGPFCALALDIQAGAVFLTKNLPPPANAMSAQVDYQREIV
jgi:hypothetical protein